ncbi:phytanoyl-CoA dioxygenase family protein [Paraliomyxa miuraensis]|uniref:phytanoyl-CoA dioxygenase family protein n=1 Tax=Paraliomyxa miuraensis TaxID=376150 RepID=UPI00225BEE4E|nr:phytanoyl-CoA dioxygenase family protein [Paraliomyxa miuraensis]MCX4246363.1 phytanoyl-CoA dioxygenase family protein [Paraliomyxa miuraensis]
MEPTVLLARFAARGFVVLPSLITLERVVELSRAINRDMKTNPFMWHEFEGAVVNRNALLSVEGVAQIVLDPLVRALVGEIFEGRARFEEAVVQLYAAGRAHAETDWHRDVPHNLDNPYRAEYVQLLVYLSEVTPQTHRFSIFAESRDEPLAGEAEPTGSAEPFDFVGAPGSAILFNASSLHGARRALDGRGRRSLHVYYGHADRPCSSESTIVPARLMRSLAPEDAALFDKRNRLSTLIFT